MTSKEAVSIIFLRFFLFSALQHPNLGLKFVCCNAENRKETVKR